MTTKQNPGSGSGESARDPRVLHLQPLEAAPHQARGSAIRQWLAIESMRTDLQPAALLALMLTADGCISARSVCMEPEFRPLFAAQLRAVADQLCPAMAQRAA